MCQSVAEILSAIIGSKFTKTIVVTQPGISRFLLEEESVSILAEMTAKFEVYIDMAKVHWEPLEDDVTYPGLAVYLYIGDPLCENQSNLFEIYYFLHKIILRVVKNIL